MAGGPRLAVNRTTLDVRDLARRYLRAFGPATAARRRLPVDGFLAGLWCWREGRVVTELFRRLTRTERAELDEEVGGVQSLLS